MQLPLLRIDDRLVHGQVLVGWAAALRPAQVLLASDAVAGDPLRRQVYAALPAEDFAIDVQGLATAAATLRRGGRVLAVCASPADARQLFDLGCGLAAVNLGGLRGPGRRQLLPFVYLTPQDVADLRALLSRGVAVEARELPGSRAVRVDEALLAPLWE